MDFIRSLAVADPDFQIRRGVRGGRPDPEIGGLPFGPQFSLKLKGGPVPSPGSATV